MITIEYPLPPCHRVDPAGAAQGRFGTLLQPTPRRRCRRPAPSVPASDRSRFLRALSSGPCAIGSGPRIVSRSAARIDRPVGTRLASGSEPRIGGHAKRMGRPFIRRDACARVWSEASLGPRGAVLRVSCPPSQPLRRDPSWRSRFSVRGALRSPRRGGADPRRSLGPARAIGGDVRALLGSLSRESAPCVASIRRRPTDKGRQPSDDGRPAANHMSASQGSESAQ